MKIKEHINIISGIITTIYLIYFIVNSIEVIDVFSDIEENPNSPIYLAGLIWFTTLTTITSLVGVAVSIIGIKLTKRYRFISIISLIIIACCFFGSLILASNLQDQL